jgi:hypothetical protein
LFLQVRRASYDAAAVVAFLRVLLRKIRGKILLSLRWLTNPSRARDQGFSQARGDETSAVGAITGVCT